MCQHLSEFFQVLPADYFSLNLSLSDDVTTWEVGDSVVIATTDYPDEKKDHDDKGQNEVFIVEKVHRFRFLFYVERKLSLFFTSFNIITRPYTYMCALMYSTWQAKEESPAFLRWY